MLIFLKTFFDYTLLKEETIKLMLQHQDRDQINYDYLKTLTNEDDINVMYENALKLDKNLKVLRSYNNMGVRYRNKIDAMNDLSSYVSDNSITFYGFTGCIITMDFDAKLIIVVFSNAIYNSSLLSTERKNMTLEIQNKMLQKLL